MSLTALLVQDDLSLELPPLVQGHLHLRGEALTSLAAVQEVAQAALLHQLTASKAGQLTEAIRAVDDGVEGLDLCVAQDKVAVWSGGEPENLVHVREAEKKHNGLSFLFQCCRSDTVFQYYVKYTLHSSATSSSNGLEISLPFLF